MMNTSLTPTAQRGVVLAAVLWLLTVIMLIVAGYSRATRTQTRLTAYQVQAAQARAAAQAGIWLGVQDLLRPAQAQLWKHDGTPRKVIFGNAVLSVRIQDEAGKIDLNGAGAELLRGLLQSAGVEEPALTSTVNAILEWRRPGNLRRVSSVGTKDYAAAGLPYGAKHGLFSSVAELRMVLGMRESVYQKIAPALTVFSQLSGIDPSVAVPAALQAVPGMSAKNVDDFLSGRGTAGQGSESSAAMDPRYFSHSQERAFTVSSTAHLRDAVVELESVISPQPSMTPPYEVLSWREERSAGAAAPKPESD